jgi:hypothetical protein
MFYFQTHHTKTNTRNNHSNKNLVGGIESTRKTKKTWFHHVQQDPGLHIRINIKIIGDNKNNN